VKVAPDVNIFWSPVASSMPRSLARLSIKGIPLDHCMCYSAAKQSPRTGAVAVGPVSTFLVAIQPSLRILVGRARASITSCLWLLQGFSHKKKQHFATNGRNSNAPSPCKASQLLWVFLS
jgi:hypothetical protein